jgi:pimeloyl-ACP methyl ester carboxylesterase
MTTEAFSIEGAGGIKLAAEARGRVDGMPVLLAHGGGQTRRAWKRVLADLLKLGFALSHSTCAAMAKVSGRKQALMTFATSQLI